ncbi:MAG: hypothetical protein WCC70_09375 [Candidatus Aquilonibacter sp.]|jgi:hypothetical protein
MINRIVAHKVLHTVLFAAFAIPLLGMTTDPVSIISLIRATPSLTIDTTVPQSFGWDPQTHPYVRLVDEHQQVGGYVDADSASIGLVAGATQVMSVPLVSGGSGGIFTQILFARDVQDATPYYLGAISSGGHLEVNITYHGVVAIYPDYAAGDPNCCPSKYSSDTYTIVDRKLKLRPSSNPNPQKS